MAATEAQKRATKAYLARVKGTPQGDRIRQKQRDCQRAYCKEKYHNNTEFREGHKEKMLSKYAPEKALRAIRYLFE